GISFCATCDGALYRDREVAVVGGGDKAIEEAIFLTKFAKKVYIIHRRDELRAVEILKDRVFKNKKIEFLWDSVVEKFIGKNKLEGILIRNKKENKTYKLKVDGVFEYIDWKPNSKLVKDLVKLAVDGFDALLKVILDEVSAEERENLKSSLSNLQINFVKIFP
ncbi:unnamed protein product, partial [marine sediment metagenome]